MNDNYWEMSFPYVFYNISKRFLDIIGSLIGIILFSPLMLIVGILVKRESEGPAIFKQVRTGQYGKTFIIYKFRTMVNDAEQKKKDLLKYNDQDGPAFKMKADLRLTKFGKKLRNTSIDEFPQFFNVLKGDMSLVGPRPLPKSEADQLNDYQKQREMVKPGLTCFWQIEGRNGLTFEKWMEKDIQYVKKCNIVLDIYLIIKTILSFLKGNRGY